MFVSGTGTDGVVLGIDPGLNTTGYGVLEFVNRQPRLIEAGVVRGKANATLPERVKEIHDGVTDVVDEPDMAVSQAVQLTGSG